MTLLATEEYVAAGYFAATDYVGGIASGVADTTTTYVEEGYIVDDYFRPGGVEFTLSATLTPIALTASATLDVTVSMSATALRIKTSPVQLSWQATLNAVAAKITDTSSTMNAIFTAEHTDDGGFEAGFDVDVTFEAASTLASSSSLSCTPLLVKLFSSSISASSSLTATAIEYRTRRVDAVAGSRPHYPSTINEASINTTTKKFGTGSLNVNVHSVDGANHWLEYTMTDDDLDKPAYLSGGSMAIEFWARGATRIETWTSDRSTDPDSDEKGWVFVTSNTGVWFYGTQDSGDQNNDNLLNGSFSGTDGNFHHVAVRIDSPSSTDTTWSMWIDGTRVETATAFLNIGESTDTMFLAFGVNENYSGNPGTQGQSYIDEFRILKGTPSELDTILGYDVGDSSITIPTAKYTNNLNTRILLHFDTDFSFYDDDTGIQLFDSTLPVSASLTSTGVTLVEASATLASAFGMSVAETKFRPGAATLSASASVNCVPLKTLNASATLSASVTTVIEPGTIKLGIVDLPSVAAQLVAASKIGDFFVNADVIFSLTSTPTVQTGAIISINSVSSITTTPEYIRGATATLPVSASLTATGERFLLGDSSMSSSANLISTGDRFRLVEADLQGFFAQLSVGTKQTLNGAVLNSTFGISIEGSRIAGANATLDSAFSVNFGGGIVASATATLPGFFAVLSVNKILHVDEFVYIVPAENRVFTINAENRTYTIDVENREYIIKGAA